MLKSLSGNQFQLLRNALVSAFPTYDKLQAMMRIELNESLPAIAKDDGLLQVAFEIITWAEAEGRLEDLINGAMKQNPGNAKLKQFVEVEVSGEISQPEVPSKPKYNETVFSIIGIIIPSLAIVLSVYFYFAGYSPPFWDDSSILSMALAVFIIIITHLFYNPTSESEPNKKVPSLLITAISVISLALILLIFYLVLLAYCTVIEPNSGLRYQIGFYKCEQSLTDEGKSVKKEHPTDTVLTWMKNDALFSEDGPSKIWTKESIILSGVMLIIVFLLTSVLWALGWCLLAKQIAIKRGSV